METIETTLQTAEQNKSSRRAAILMGGAALAGLAFARKSEAQSADIDLAILNFALNLEYLEAQYYTLATQGKTIEQVGVDITGIGVPGGGLITPGKVTVKNASAALPNGDYSSCLVPFTTPLLEQFANQVAADERNHVAFLHTAVGSTLPAGSSTPVTQAAAMPNIDLCNSFQALAVATKLTTADKQFDPFASEANFLLGAYIFEDVGVTAYHGAAGLLTNKAFLDKAAGILAVEAYHAGAIRTRIYAAGAAAQAASQAISAGRAGLDLTTNDDIGVGVDSTGAATVVDADSNAIAFSRTTLQVRQIVYAVGLPQQPIATFPPPSPFPTPVNNSLGKGGFFPTGMTGPLG